MEPTIVTSEEAEKSSIADLMKRLAASEKGLAGAE